MNELMKLLEQLLDLTEGLRPKMKAQQNQRWDAIKARFDTIKEAMNLSSDIPGMSMPLADIQASMLTPPPEDARGQGGLSAGEIHTIYLYNPTPEQFEQAYLQLTGKEVAYPGRSQKVLDMIASSFEGSTIFGTCEVRWQGSASLKRVVIISEDG